MTALAGKLRQRIRMDGPIPVAEYMAACLGDPDHGYYRHRQPFGREGDFVTAPEISQVFGELIGAWMIATWEAMGSPSPFVLAELGPGRGTLMADILRTAQIRPPFASAARIHLVESSPSLRDLQRTTLDKDAASVTWHDHVDALPAAALILVANEFFDALPIRQFAWNGSGWAERMVGLEGDRLAFGLVPAALDPGELGRSAMPPPPAGTSAIVEVSPTATAIAAVIGDRLVRHGGVALTIDYGYEGPAAGDTLQAVRGHRFEDPLAVPGEADLTAHVDFAALARAAESAGAKVRRLWTQGAFLQGLGIAARAERLARGKDEATREAIFSGVDRLSSLDKMGKMFKVLAISDAALTLPLFDPALP